MQRMTDAKLPILITFDGQARSGKGTIAHALKKALNDADIKTMLIDAGQVFRVLAVSVIEQEVDINSPDAIDAFLSDQAMLEQTKDLVKRVYHMSHDERDSMLYTAVVGADSAKIGGRPKSQDFKDSLVRKWLQDAADEGYEVVLLDGRACEEVGVSLEAAGLCDYKIGMYFTCDPLVGARRMLGLATTQYADLTDKDRHEVDALAHQIVTRNTADAKREVQPIVPPAGAQNFTLPHFEPKTTDGSRQMFVIDTSNDMTKETMYTPVVDYICTMLMH